MDWLWFQYKFQPAAALVKPHISFKTQGKDWKCGDNTAAARGLPTIGLGRVMLDLAPVRRSFLMSSSLSISKVGPESDVLLRNLFEHYIHDMAEWFEIDTKPDGSYSYDTSLVWEKGYDAYLAKVGDSIAGFALVGSAVEWLGEIGAYDVLEFFVIRRFRRSGVGQTMASLLWNERPGE